MDKRKTKSAKPAPPDAGALRARFFIFEFLFSIFFAIFADPEAVWRPGVVADPTERFEAAAKTLGDRRRKPSVRVVEPARVKILFACAM